MEETDLVSCEFWPPGDGFDAYTTYPRYPFIYRLCRVKYTAEAARTRWAELEARGVKFYGESFYDARYWCRMSDDLVAAVGEAMQVYRELMKWGKR